MKRIYLTLLLLMGLSITSLYAKDIYFYGAKNNNIYELLVAEGYKVKVFDDPYSLVRRAKKGATVLLIGKNYPKTDSKLVITPEIINQIKKKNLKVYLEFPYNYPNLDLSKTLLETRMERAVINADNLGSGLEKMNLLAIQNAFIQPVEVENPLIVMAKVVGFDKAEFGLTDTKVSPILFEKDGILISTTGLSNFKTGRYGPKETIKKVWEYIINSIAPSNQKMVFKTWPQDVYPAFQKDEAIPKDARANSIKEAAEWYDNGNFFVDNSWKAYWLEKQGNGTMPVGPPVPQDYKNGDGKLGILEGHTSTINFDGTQQYRYWMRADVQAEAAMALAAAGSFLNNDSYKKEAANLLDFLFETSNLRADQKDNPKSPSYGLIGWATTHPNSFYADDNARVLLGAMIAADYLKSDKWNKKIIEGILGNFRITGINGFQGERIEEAYIQQDGWKKYGERDIIHISPHFESWMWACYLWLYDKTGYQPLLEKTKKAIQITMDAYPNKWLWGSSMQMQRARMILPLAWLVRAEDTPQHRAWLTQMIDEVEKFQDETGGLREEIGGDVGRRFKALNSNADYGTDEGSLIFKNGDKASCSLYTCNFALFGLSEASAALNDEKYSNITNKLSDYMTRIQVKSPVHKDLNGAWLRGFDFGRWDYWASNSDIGWGTWCTLTGWIQSWILSSQIQLEQKQNVWDLTKDTDINRQGNELIKLMMNE